jgi:hypothetical protein
MISAKLFYLAPFLFLILTISTSCEDQNLHLKLEINDDASEVQYGVQKLLELESGGKAFFSENNAKYVVRTAIDSSNLKSEAFQIQVKNDLVQITGGDPVGVMYGLLDVKEQIEFGLPLSNKAEEPELSFRAIKFNLPWDSYRTGASLDVHLETCRDTNFWYAFLDMMAENRFNKLTLWNLHPFNYLVKTKKYPEACGFSDAEMTDWRIFWQTLFKAAKDRGIETYLVNWNIFISPEFAKAHNVAIYSITKGHHFGDGDTSEVIKDYMRECVREVIDAYPDLTGLGITLGEGMGGMTPEEREQWLLDSYIEGARRANRKIKFIHRVPLSAGKGSGGSTSTSVEQMTRQTLDTLSCFIKPIQIELKFNWSHAHSSPKLVKVHGGKLADTYWNPEPENYKLAWMMRNEDFFMLRWGQADFIREHIDNNVLSYVNGYYVGSECYIPAKDYITTLEGTSYKYAFERQWMYYKNWGRLLYNPHTPDMAFEQAFTNRFPEHGQLLHRAQTKASRVPLIIASYWNATWDYTLYTEGMISLMGHKTVKLLSLAQFCEKVPMDPDYVGVQAYLKNESGDFNGKITPYMLADSMETFCSQAIAEIEKIEPGENMDLLYEVSDIKTWAHLGLYFADKLRAAVHYQKYLDSDDPDAHKLAVTWLEKAVGHWKDVVNVTNPVYKPVPLMHYTHGRDDQMFHWSKVEKEVIEELGWLRGVVNE